MLAVCMGCVVISFDFVWSVQYFVVEYDFFYSLWALVQDCNKNHSHTGVIAVLH